MKNSCLCWLSFYLFFIVWITYKQYSTVHTDTDIKCKKLRHCSRYFAHTLKYRSFFRRSVVFIVTPYRSTLCLRKKRATLFSSIILANLGRFLCFVPLKKKMNTLQLFKIYLLNRYRSRRCVPSKVTTVYFMELPVKIKYVTFEDEVAIKAVSM